MNGLILLNIKKSLSKALKTPTTKLNNMGRIKQLMVKRAGRELITKDLPFGEQFNGNKKILGSTMPSKKVRNKIAGYISRLKKAQRLVKEEGIRIKQKEVKEEDSSYS